MKQFGEAPLMNEAPVTEVDVDLSEPAFQIEGKTKEELLARVDERQRHLDDLNALIAIVKEAVEIKLPAAHAVLLKEGDGWDDARALAEEMGIGNDMRGELDKLTTLRIHTLDASAYAGFVLRTFRDPQQLLKAANKEAYDTALEIEGLWDTLEKDHKVSRVLHEVGITPNKKSA